MTDRISVVVRSMDRATLPRALDSIAASGDAHLEIVLVAANGDLHRAMPPDWRGTPIVFVSPGGRLRRAAAANAGLEAARGDWIGFLDDDDAWLPNHASAWREAIAAREGERVIYTRTSQRDADGREVNVLGIPSAHLRLFETPTLHFAAGLVHRSLIDDGVRVDESLDLLEDIDFWIQCARRTDFFAHSSITNVWNADVGSSGAGAGANRDDDAIGRAQAYIAAKWEAEDRASRSEARVLVIEAQRLLSARRDRDAIALLDRALAIRPRDLNALNLAGLAHHYLGERERARRLLARAVALYPQAAPVRENLALVERD